MPLPILSILWFSAVNMAPGTIRNPYATKKGSSPLTSPSPDPSSIVGVSVSLHPTTFSQAFGLDDNSVNDASENYSSNNPLPDSNNDLRNFHVHLQPHVLAVSPRQKGNGLLQYIKNVPLQYSNMVPDYILSTTSCALFLSLKYHQLYPHYIHRRLSELGKDFRLRVLLVLVDVDDCANSLLFLNELGVTHDLTLILSWSETEAARYLETFKAFDGKDASSIQKRESNNVVDQVTDFVTACKPLTKTDAAVLWQQFGTLSGVSKASADELALCPGLGKVKVRQLHAALHKPFCTRASRKRRQEAGSTDESPQQDVNESPTADGSEGAKSDA